MKKIWILSIVFALHSPLFAATRLGSFYIDPGPSFETHQTSVSRDISMMGIRHLLGSVQLFVRPLGASQNYFEWTPDTRIIDGGTFLARGLEWTYLNTLYPHPMNDGKTIFTTVFRSEWNGYEVYGYVQADSEARSFQVAKNFVQGIIPLEASNRSLTPEGFAGKKYYLGFGDLLTGSMGNEVKYDIKHTNDIFTSDLGGNYEASQFISDGDASGIREYWTELKEKMTFADMYVQYSAGHGSPTGLAYGVSYAGIRDNVLALPAKEIVVFIMACHSGGLVDSFNQKKSVWENWGQWKRTLFVLASSKVSQTSSTGPGKDEDEPNGPSGSAGSAFGHALWKALIGYADGFNNGVKDGFLNLGEILDFSIKKTQQVGGHTPVATGVYSRELIMNRVPTAAEIAALGPSTEDLTEAQVIERIQELDRRLRVR